MSLCLDLGCGLGGASAAFRDSGWDVIGIDIDRRFRPTIQADYSRLPLRTGLAPDMVLAAPDCRCFSVAGLRFHWDRGEPLPHTSKAIDTTKRMVAEIKRLAPRFAVVENPTGMMRDARVLGRPRHHIRMSDYGSRFKKPTDLWEYGREKLRFAMLEAMLPWIKSPSGANVFRNETATSSGRPDIITETSTPLRAPAVRSLWPYGLSRAILEAATR